MTVSNSSPRNTRVSPRLSRTAMRRRLQRRNRTIQRLRSQIDHLHEQNRALTATLAQAAQQRQLDQQELLWQQASQEVTPPDALQNDRPLRGHQFGVKLIAASIELAKRIGFRATEFVWSFLFELLGIELKVPSHDAIEQWTLRLGVSELQDTFTKDQRVLWLADHSNQIGKEKVLLIIGVALEDLPPAGQTLKLEHMKVLAIVPGEQWKKEDVEREYRKLAEKIGAPVYLLCDGATELREPAEKLEKDGKPTIVLGDLKHHAANLLEKEIGRSERFKAFMTEVGLTRNRVQQTELSHFTPPPVKQKSRFMNLGPLLSWSAMVLHHLNDPSSDARAGIDENRMEEKLGWLRSFAEDLAQWKACQTVIDESLSVINHQGLSATTPVSLRRSLDALEVEQSSSATPSSRIAGKLLEWVSQAASSLHGGERARLSTEILESLFGRYKRLERQHSKGGFTRLIAAFPTLCFRVDGESVRQGFGKVNAQDLKAWLHVALPRTLTSRRNSAYHEYRSKSRDHISTAA